MEFDFENANEAWWNTMAGVWRLGERCYPRGQTCYEIPQLTISIPMNRPVVTCRTRKLSYGFMAAEAWWILHGDDRVDGIAPFNKHISQFSDDGKIFFGAYGPKIVDQLPYVVNTLQSDRDSRQAVISIWREKPPTTKDVPCTLSMTFMIRRGCLNEHVFMRSSDVWLGVPYDLFNFAMIGYRVIQLVDPTLEPGRVFLTAASSHLYARDTEKIEEVLSAGYGEEDIEPVPDIYCREGIVMMNDLMHLRVPATRDRSSWRIRP